MRIRRSSRSWSPPQKHLVKVNDRLRAKFTSIALPLWSPSMLRSPFTVGLQTEFGTMRTAAKAEETKENAVRAATGNMVD